MTNLKHMTAEERAELFMKECESHFDDLDDVSEEKVRAVAVKLIIKHIRQAEDAALERAAAELKRLEAQLDLAVKELRKTDKYLDYMLKAREIRKADERRK
jgi:hypothetical protein